MDERRHWKVGEPARQSGLTVRTVRHWPQAVGARQLQALDRRMEHDRRLRELLVRVLESSDCDDLLATVEAIRMSDRYYTPEQQAELARRRDELGAEGIQRAQRDWADLIAAIEAEREAGTDPGDPRVQQLARRWSELVEAFTGGDPGIRASLRRIYQEQGPEQASRGALSAEPAAYVAEAQSQASR